MASPHEQSSPVLSDEDLPASELLVSDAGDEQVVAPNGNLQLTISEAPLAGRRLGPPGDTREECQAAGYEAYDQATKRRIALKEQNEQLDEETVRLYRKADADLLAADVWQGSGDRPRNPFNMLTRAACLGWQAEAMGNGVFYDSPHGHIDVKSNLQELAEKELEGANEILLGEDQTIKALAGEMTAVNPGIIAEAAAEAAVEAGTDEHVVVRGIGKVDEGTPERLEAEGKEGLKRFIGEHAMNAAHGGMFTAMVAEKEATGVHRLPVAA